MRWRRLAMALMTCILVLVLPIIAQADYTTDQGYTVQWTGGTGGQDIVVKDGSGRVIYSGPGTRDKYDRLVPPPEVAIGRTPTNPQNVTNPHYETAAEGYIQWQGDVPILNHRGDLVGWGSLYHDPRTGLGKTIMNDPVTGSASGDWVRNTYDGVYWNPSGNGYGGWVCVGCDPSPLGGGYRPPGSPSNNYPPGPPPPPPSPPVNVVTVNPSTGGSAKRGQAVTLTIATSGPVSRVQVELPEAFKNVPVQFGDGQTQVVENTHVNADAAGTNQWTYRFVLAWTQSRPADGTYRIRVRAYGNDGQVDTEEIDFTVNGIVNIYSPGG